MPDWTDCLGSYDLIWSQFRLNARRVALNNVHHCTVLVSAAALQMALWRDHCYLLLARQPTVTQNDHCSLVCSLLNICPAYKHTHSHTHTHRGTCEHTSSHTRSSSMPLGLVSCLDMLFFAHLEHHTVEFTWYHKVTCIVSGALFIGLMSLGIV